MEATTSSQKNDKPYRPQYSSRYFFIYVTKFVLFIAVLENSVFHMDWDGSNDTLNVTSVVYSRYLCAVTKNSKWRSELAVIQR